MSGTCSELLREKRPEGPTMGSIMNQCAHLFAPRFTAGQTGNAWGLESGNPGLVLGLVTDRCGQVTTSWSPNSCKGIKNISGTLVQV